MKPSLNQKKRDLNLLISKKKSCLANKKSNYLKRDSLFVTAQG